MSDRQADHGGFASGVTTNQGDVQGSGEDENSWAIKSGEGSTWWEFEGERWVIDEQASLFPGAVYLGDETVHRVSDGQQTFSNQEFLILRKAGIYYEKPTDTAYIETGLFRSPRPGDVTPSHYSRGVQHYACHSAIVQPILEPLGESTNQSQEAVADPNPTDPVVSPVPVEGGRNDA